MKLFSFFNTDADDPQPQQGLADIVRETIGSYAQWTEKIMEFKNISYAADLGDTQPLVHLDTLSCFGEEEWQQPAPETRQLAIMLMVPFVPVIEQMQEDPGMREALAYWFNGGEVVEKLIHDLEGLQQGRIFDDADWRHNAHKPYSFNPAKPEEFFSGVTKSVDYCEYEWLRDYSRFTSRLLEQLDTVESGDYLREMLGDIKLADLPSTIYLSVSSEHRNDFGMSYHSEDDLTLHELQAISNIDEIVERHKTVMKAFEEDQELRLSLQAKLQEYRILLDRCYNQAEEEWQRISTYTQEAYEEYRLYLAKEDEQKRIQAQLEQESKDEWRRGIQGELRERFDLAEQ